MIFTKAWLKGAGERALKAFVQSLLAVIGVSAAAGQNLGITDIHWSMVLSIAALAAVLSVATSIGNASFVAGGAVQPGPEPAPTDTAEALPDEDARVPADADSNQPVG